MMRCLTAALPLARVAKPKRVALHSAFCYDTAASSASGTPLTQSNMARAASSSAYRPERWHDNLFVTSGWTARTRPARCAVVEVEV